MRTMQQKAARTAPPQIMLHVDLLLGNNRERNN
jgi:hypothetical protein